MHVFRKVRKKLKERKSLEKDIFFLLLSFYMGLASSIPMAIEIDNLKSRLNNKDKIEIEIKENTINIQCHDPSLRLRDLSL